MIKFIVGAMVGGCVSFFFLALLIAARENKTKKQIKAEVLKEFTSRLKHDKQKFRDIILFISWKEYFDELIDYELMKELEDSE